jgi:ABC-2 type transport system ATP-binding protein
MSSLPDSMVTVQTAQPLGPEVSLREPSARMPLVLEAVERAWGRRQVLQGATLGLAPGTAAWLGGPNGAGKTTLLRIAAGLLAPHGGRVTLLGLDAERDRRAYQQHLGFLSAGDRGLTARLTARQNLELWSALALVPRARRRLLIEQAIVRFALQDLAPQRVDRLSMGQRQRVRLAMAFLHEPTVVLLDEPHTSLDDFGLGLLEDAIAQVTGRGGAVLWCSPTRAGLPIPADESYELRGGRILGRA